jgi:hypothetical protein
MAFNDYLAVLNSDLYEHQGTTKAVLARIAHLIIAPPKEDDVTGKQLGEPNADVGFCVASQEYIACQLGLSVSKVWKAIQLFQNDRWLTVDKHRDRYGDHNKYRWADGAWDRLVARKRQKDEKGEYVRRKQVSMERWPAKGRFARVKDASSTREPDPLREERSADYADSVETTTPIALSALRRQRSKLVGLDVDLSMSSNSETKAETHDDTSQAPLGINQNPKPEQTPTTKPLVIDKEITVPVQPVAKPQPTTVPQPSSREPKRVCQFVNCGGPLKGNCGVCLKCGAEPLRRFRRAQAAPEPEDPHVFATREHSAVCQNPGCETTRLGFLYGDEKYCYYAKANGATAV